jgi:glycosyltransferase involved in cell wall biosynthesis
VAVVTDAVLPWNIGGKERRLFEILSRLEPATIEPRIFTMKWWDGPSRCTEGGLVHEALLARKSLYTPIGKRSILEAVLFAIASLKLLSKDFDVIDVDSMPFFPVIAMKLMSLIRRKPLLATWHEVWGRAYWVAYLGRLGFLAAMVERLAVRCPDVIISDSEHTSRRLLSLGARTVVTVPLGADLDRLTYQPEPVEPEYDVVYMGRLMEHKNVGVLLQAAQLLREQGRVIRLLIVGDGPSLDGLVEVRDELGLQDLVRFQPFVTEAAYSRTMRSGRLFVLPSLREGFGLVVLEANSCGLPVIVVDHPDNAAVDLIQPGVNGLISGGSVAALAATIGEALDNISSFSVAEHTASAVAKYDWKEISRAYSAIILNTVAGEGVGG